LPLIRCFFQQESSQGNEIKTSRIILNLLILSENSSSGSQSYYDFCFLPQEVQENKCGNQRNSSLSKLKTSSRIK